ncbi:uncharacterized protein LOC127770748 [Oryza glaberrima]|uniref:uncharacterized protein LOC127770748 n=1 Tax=Oryza glaberrima TaxID=4538 RepID=UPI00224C5A23|nr:uncharacterized protein LOC127770748 [Oryza glaberrima]
MLAAPTQDAAAPPAALDAEAVANLHSQAVAVLNVKALVPVTLDLDANNYSRWRGLFLVTLGKYALTDHVFSDVPRPDHADWTQMDCVVLGWLYGSIFSTLMQEVLSPTATARSVWRDLELQFLGNGERRAVNLTAELQHLQQGDLSIGDYYRRLKVLADVGEPVKDRSLILTLIGGLNDKFDNLKSLLPLQVPFPMFAEARAQLLLDELTKGHRPAGTATAFLAASSTTARSATSTNTSNKNSRNNSRRRGHGSGGGGGGRSIHMWPGQAGLGLLGARPNFVGTAFTTTPAPAQQQAFLPPAYAALWSQAGPTGMVQPVCQLSPYTQLC